MFISGKDVKVMLQNFNNDMDNGCAVINFHQMYVPLYGIHTKK